MALSFTAKKRIRKSYGELSESVQMPNLIEVQRESYEQFLRSDPATGYVSGLEKTLRSVFPIRDFAGTSELDFVHYELEDPKYDTTECRQRGITYAAPMKVTLRLIVFEVDAETETRSVLDIKEQDVYMGDMPLMTENGTFIINGTERVIVSQLHRSPGVLFDHDRGKTHSSGKLLFSDLTVDQGTGQITLRAEVPNPDGTLLPGLTGIVGGAIVGNDGRIDRGRGAAPVDGECAAELVAAVIVFAGRHQQIARRDR